MRTTPAASSKTAARRKRNLTVGAAPRWHSSATAKDALALARAQIHTHATVTTRTPKRAVHTNTIPHPTPHTPTSHADTVLGTALDAQQARQETTTQRSAREKRLAAAETRLHGSSTGLTGSSSHAPSTPVKHTSHKKAGGKVAMGVSDRRSTTPPLRKLGAATYAAASHAVAATSAFLHTAATPVAEADDPKLGQFACLSSTNCHTSLISFYVWLPYTRTHSRCVLLRSGCATQRVRVCCGLVAAHCNSVAWHVSQFLRFKPTVCSACLLPGCWPRAHCRRSHEAV